MNTGQSGWNEKHGTRATVSAPGSCVGDLIGSDASGPGDHRAGSPRAEMLLRISVSESVSCAGDLMLCALAVLEI